MSKYIIFYNEVGSREAK